MTTGRELVLKDHTIRAIKDAYLKLYDVGGISNVTMSQVAKECEISRSTLYSYYSSIEDIEDDITLDFYREMHRKFPAIYNKTWHGESIAEPLRNHFQYCKDNRAEAMIALERDWLVQEAFPLSAEVLLKEIHRNHPERHISEDEDLCLFYISGAYEYFRRWLNTGCQQSIDDIVSVYLKALNAFIGH